MKMEDRERIIEWAWSRALALTFAFVLGMGLAWAITLTARQPPGEPILLQPPPTQPPLVVYVTCAVAHPGVYQVPRGSRVKDAVDAAGGATAEANLEAINLAARVEDGQQICVPAHQPTAPVAVYPSATPPTATPVVGYKLNINTADAAQLDALPGIGPALAQRIIAYRQEHGPFASVDDLVKVPGIGPATLERLRPWITTGITP